MSSLRVDSFLLGSIVSQRSGIQQFFDIELLGICSGQVGDFFVRLTDNFIIQSQTRTTQLRQDFVSQSLVNRRDILDFLFSLFRIRIHRQNTQDQFLVLDVGLAYQFLEAFPVLSSVFRVYIYIDLILLQVLVDNLGSVVLTIFSQCSVQFHTTIRRSVCRDFDVADLLVGSFAYVLHFFVEGLGSLQFAGTNVCLLDQEHDVSVMLFLDDALESVVTVSSVCAGQSLVNEFRSRDNTVSDLHSGDFYCLLTDFSLEFQIQFRLGHFGNIVERSLHCIAATHLVGDSLVVAFHLLTLEYSRLAFGLATVPLQNGSNFHNSLLVEVLFGEFAVDCSGNLTTYGFQYLRSHREIVR